MRTARALVVACEGMGRDNGKSLKLISCPRILSLQGYDCQRILFESGDLSVPRPENWAYIRGAFYGTAGAEVRSAAASDKANDD